MSQLPIRQQFHILTSPPTAVSYPGFALDSSFVSWLSLWQQFHSLASALTAVSCPDFRPDNIFVSWPLFLTTVSCPPLPLPTAVSCPRLFASKTLAMFPRTRKKEPPASWSFLTKTAGSPCFQGFSAFPYVFLDIEQITSTWLEETIMMSGEESMYSGT